MLYALTTALIRELRSANKARKEREKEQAELFRRQEQEKEQLENRKKQIQKLTNIYEEAVSNYTIAGLPLREHTKTYIAVKTASSLNDEQRQKIIQEHENGKKITLPLDAEELKRLDEEADRYIAQLEAEAQEEQWQQIISMFRSVNKSQQALLLKRFKAKGLDEDHLFILQMIYLEDESSTATE